MAFTNDQNLSKNVFDKLSIINTAMVFNLVPKFDEQTQTLSMHGLFSNLSNQLVPMQINIHNRAIPDTMAAQDIVALKRVYNAYASKHERSEHGYDAIPVYYPLNIGKNLQDSYEETLAPEEYVEDMLTVMYQSGIGLEKQTARAYAAFVDRNFKAVVEQIKGSTWDEKEEIAKGIEEYWKQVSSQLQPKVVAQSKPEGTALGDEE